MHNPLDAAGSDFPSLTALFPLSTNVGLFCHATEGPLKWVPGPTVANYVAIDDPLDQVRLP